jgi:hypothetical protein
VTLYIVQLCVALYVSGDHITEPFAIMCVEFTEPVAYDVELCSGEVTTPSVDDWSHATCEITVNGKHAFTSPPWEDK